MRSNYKQLGKYITEVNIRNSDLQGKTLLGVSIQKVLMPSIANIIGTDMSTYKIIRKNQFAYGPVTSRNGDKISIALLTDYEEAMISQAYTCFDIVDKDTLWPEYLMMWFRRPEFDRYARFMSHGSAREIFGWEEMCNVELPIPSIEKQKEIVKEYHTIVNRISLNEQLNKKLEETAQAIYKQWFVDFEFPDENGNPYKSSGGEMEFNAELETEIPSGWEVGNLSNLYKFQYGYGNNNPDNGGSYPVYGSNGVIGGYDKYNNEEAPVIGHIGINCGSVVFAYGKHYVTYNGIMCNVIETNKKYFGYATLLNKDLKSQTRGSSQPFISYDMLYELDLVIPDDRVIAKFSNVANSVFENTGILLNELYKLKQFAAAILSKMTKEK